MIYNLKKAFTLAEVMVVLTVIGIIAAIVIPALFLSAPDKNALRAKKAFNTISRAVETLTNDEPYALNGGLLEAAPFVTVAPAADISLQDAKNQFFCNNLTEILNVASADCSLDYVNTNIQSSVCNEGDLCATSSSEDAPRYIIKVKTPANESNAPDLAPLKAGFDSACAELKQSDKYNFKTVDGVYWGIQLVDFSYNGTYTYNGLTSPSGYGLICISTASSDTMDENSIFGLGVRKDGKILVGDKLQEILETDDSNLMGTDESDSTGTN